MFSDQSEAAALGARVRGFQPDEALLFRRSRPAEMMVVGTAFIVSSRSFQVSGGFSGEQTASPVCFSVVLNCC